MTHDTYLRSFCVSTTTSDPSPFPSHWSSLSQRTYPQMMLSIRLVPGPPVDLIGEPGTKRSGDQQGLSMNAAEVRSIATTRKALSDVLFVQGRAKTR